MTEPVLKHQFFFFLIINNGVYEDVWVPLLRHMDTCKVFKVRRLGQLDHAVAAWSHPWIYFPCVLHALVGLSRWII